jgi:hypothetical protein
MKAVRYSADVTAGFQAASSMSTRHSEPKNGSFALLIVVTGSLAYDYVELSTARRTTTLRV